MGNTLELLQPATIQQIQDLFTIDPIPYEDVSASYEVEGPVVVLHNNVPVLKPAPFGTIYPPAYTITDSGFVLASKREQFIAMLNLARSSAGNKPMLDWPNNKYSHKIITNNPTIKQEYLELGPQMMPERVLYIPELDGEMKVPARTTYFGCIWVRGNKFGVLINPEFILTGAANA